MHIMNRLGGLVNSYAGHNLGPPLKAYRTASATRARGSTLSRSNITCTRFYNPVIARFTQEDDSIMLKIRALLTI
ncbi:hypothetical protein ABEV00_10595 [Paenibacillus thiaminolyticus]|uniref:hypothetical protein n=1 Tax=Paenibacillus thiaminolyticus TaxID=49283 RepID=UPI003D2656CD